MKTLCVTPCGSKKIWDKFPEAGPTPARYVYIGPFAHKCQEYAREFYPMEWCILSAKYGFLFPDDIVPGSYNVSFNDRKTNPISVVELINQAGKKDLFHYDQFVVLAGKNYVNMIKKIFTGKQIITPLSDCKGIGYMMGKMNDAIEDMEPISS